VKRDPLDWLFWLAMGMVLIVALQLACDRASAATWTSELPTTGSPCEQWHWRAFDPSGVPLFDVLTDSNWVTLPEPAVPLKVMCSCRDDSLRWSPWSEPSEPFFPPAVIAQYARAGTILRVSALSAVVALIQSVKWEEPK